MNLTIIEILILLIPAIIIAVTVIIIVRYYYKHSENERRAELILKNQEITLPLRLQAYERMTLFLERISPDSLLMRHNQSNITSRQLHSILLTSIRNEFEHNLSQQIYMSPKAWELVKNARSQIIKVINTAAEKVDPKAPAIELSKKILEIVGEYDKYPTAATIEYLKKEIKDLI